MPVRNLITLLLAASISLFCYHRAARNRYESLVAKSLSVIWQEYVGKIDARDLFVAAMHGMTEKLDPYSSFVSPEDYGLLKEELDQEFGGVGIFVELHPETQRLTILNPLLNSPAHAAGMQAGDTIAAIDGQDTQGFSLKDAVDRMRGKPGSQVQLTVTRPGEQQPLTFTLTRAIIPIESVLGDVRNPDGTWQFVLQQDPRIGYVRLESFGENSANELRLAVDSISDEIGALIIDLRANAGGLLTSAVEIADMFVGDERIVSTRRRRGVIEDVYVGKADNEILDVHRVPMVILIDKFSASASEILAACLQDHRAAVIVGQRSWGKGSVQNVMELEGGRSALKLTTASYWRPSGKNIHRLPDDDEQQEWGVSPNKGFAVVLSETQMQQRFAARRDRDVGRTYRPRPQLPNDPPPTTNAATDADDRPSTPEANPPANDAPHEASPNAPQTSHPGDSNPGNPDPGNSNAADPQAGGKTDQEEIVGLADFDPNIDPQLGRAVAYLQKVLGQTPGVADTIGGQDPNRDPQELEADKQGSNNRQPIPNPVAP